LVTAERSGSEVKKKTGLHDKAEVERDTEDVTKPRLMDCGF